MNFNFENETFYITNLKLEDAKSLSHLMMLNAKQFQEYLPKTLSQNLSEEASKIYIKQKNEALQNKTEFTLAIKEKQSQEVAGLIILKNIDYKLKQAEFAYCLGSKFSGNGWITKSVLAIKDFAFNELKLTTLQIIIHHTNIASINVATRAGFIWKKTLENEFVSGKSTLDMELYEAENDTYEN